MREIGYGQWEGSTLPEMQLRDPELYARRQTEKWSVSPPGGESYIEVQARMQDWYASVTADTVAVAHGGTARALMVALGIETPISRRRPDHRAGGGLRLPRRGVAEV